MAEIKEILFCSCNTDPKFTDDNLRIPLTSMGFGAGSVQETLIHKFQIVLQMVIKPHTIHWKQRRVGIMEATSQMSKLKYRGVNGLIYRGVDLLSASGQKCLVYGHTVSQWQG